MHDRKLAKTGVGRILGFGVMVVLGIAACSAPASPEGPASGSATVAPALLSSGPPLASLGCQCVGTQPGNVQVTVACGQSICGTDFNVWSCTDVGWSGPGQSCNPDAGADAAPACQCTGAQPGDVTVTVACGQSICGTDFNVWTCGDAGWSGSGQGCNPDAGTGVDGAPPCQCVGTQPGNISVTIACGQSICGTDFNVWACGDTGWTGTGQSCNPDAGVAGADAIPCQCAGTGPGGSPITAACGQSICGEDYHTWSCSSYGWSGPGQACSGNGTADGATGAGLTVSPAVVDFGVLQPGVTSAPVTLTVTNSGAAVINLTIPSNASLAPFNLDQATGCLVNPMLASGASCSLVVTFVGLPEGGGTPTTTVVKDLTITTADSGGALATSTLSGTTFFVLSMTPAAHDFGTVLPGVTSKPVTLTVTNNGAVELNLTMPSNESLDPFNLDQTSGCAANPMLAPAASCQLVVTFVGVVNPGGAANPAVRELTVTGGEGSAAMATTTLTGTTFYLLSISPAMHDFGMVMEGATSAQRAFTVTNNSPAGSLTLSVPTNESLAPFNLDQFSGCANGTILAPLSSCTLGVSFIAEVGGGGTTAVRELTVTADGQYGAFTTATLTGTTVGILTVTPSAHDFGQVAEGSTSAPQAFTVTNNGPVAVSLSIPTNLDLAPFNIDPFSGCANGATLSPGASCVLGVTFVGEVGAAGTTVVKDLVVSGNGHTATTTLHGTTVKPAKLVAVGFDNNAGMGSYPIHLGAVRKGGQSGDVKLTFQNTGGVATSAIAYQWEGLSPNTPDAEFVFVGESGTNCIGRPSLAAGATCTVTIHFSPSFASSAGARGPKGFFMAANSGGLVGIFAFTATVLDPAGSAYIGVSGGPNGFYTFPGMTPSGAPTPPSQIFQLVNGTASSATLSWSNSNAADFGLTTNAGPAPCGATLAASASCTFAVEFHPTPWTATSAYRFANIQVTGFTQTGTTSLGIMGRVQE